MGIRKNAAFDLVRTLRSQIHRFPGAETFVRGGDDAHGLDGIGHVVAEVDVFLTDFLSSFPVFR
jgi:hypothetical protein